MVGAASNESTLTRASDGSFVPHVLLIDDNMTQLRMRAFLLREAGFSVLTSSTGRAGSGISSPICGVGRTSSLPIMSGLAPADRRS